MAQLSVELTANIQRLEKELADARKQLAQTGEVAENAAKKIGRTGTNAGKGLSSLTKGAANATPTLQEFSRVIQDAPFGIVGVGNNITQLVGNFGNLQKAAGGTRAAFGLLLGSLAGPGGFLFAISTIVTLLTIFGDRLFKSTKEADKLGKALDRIDEKFSAQLALNKATTENLELQGESLESIRRQRIQILNEQLKSVNTILAQNTALLEQVKIQNEVVSDWELISQTVGRVAAGAFVLLKGTFDQSKAALDALRKPLEEALGFEIDRSGFTAATAEELARQQELENKNNELKAQALGLTNDILKIEKEITKEKEKAKNTLSASQPIPAGLGGIFAVQPGAFADLQNKTNKAIDKYINTTGQKFRDGAAKINALDLSPIELRVQGVLQSMELSIDNFLAGSIGDLGFAIGEALAQGANVIGAIGQSLAASFARFLSEMGDQLIQYGLLAKAKGAIDVALAKGGPASIAAGIAAIAIGVALKAASGAFASVARGGFGASSVAGQGTQTFSGSASSATTSAFDSGGEVVFVISGQNLVGVLNRNLKKRGRTVADVL